ncbi:MAG: GldG family protein [Candidatus Gracilibacteria bacterium]
MKTRPRKIFFASIGTLLVLGILIALNIVLSSSPLRLDLTSNKVYTFSAITKDALSGLDDPIIIKAYITDNVPDEKKEDKKYLENLLKEFKVYGKGKVQLEFINPNESTEKETEAQQAGITPLQFNKIENDSVSIQRGYLGVSIQYGDKKELIPYITSTNGLEYDLTSRIRKVTNKNLPVVGIIQGYGAPELSGYTQGAYTMQMLTQELNKSYKVLPVDLASANEIDPSIGTLIIGGIKEAVPAEKIALIKKFSDNGGNILVSQSSVGIDISQGITAKEIPLETLNSFLSSEGITISKNLLADRSAKQIGVSTQNGTLIMQQLVSFPLLPLIKDITPHLITEKLTAVTLPFASPLTITNNTGITTLLYSSKNSSEYTNINVINPIEPDSFFNQESASGSKFPIALIKESQKNNKTASLIVVGSSGCIIDQLLQASQDTTCLKLILNAVDTTLQDARLIEVRNKGFETRLLRETTSEEKLLFKTIALGLPSFLTILGGLLYLRFRYSRMKKNYLK